MNMRRLSFLLLGVVLSATFFSKATAQSNTLPSFNMMLSNGKLFAASELSAGKPVILIYFAPGCDHCEQLMGAFFRNIHAFQEAEVVMVTFKPLSEVSRFEQAWQTSKYPNIKVGTEGDTFYLRTYYRLDRTPFMALYNKKQTLVYLYRKETAVDDLITRLKQLN
jgi:hypothetical protein